MIRRLALLVAALLLSVGGVSVWSLATAQEDESEERGAFIRFVENTISTPDRQIRLGSINGALSSDVRISTITISDREGVWLTVNDAHLVWSRLALLRGRLDIDLLEAASIVVERPPVAAEDAPTPAASEPFTLPDLPVEVLIDRLTVPEVVLGAPVLGDPARLAVEGSIALAGGALDANLAIERTDETPGSLALTAAYADETGQLDLDLTVDEPANGVIANLIGIPDRPAVRFTIAGSGPLEDFAARIALAADGEELLGGAVTLSAANGGLRFVTDLSGMLERLFPPAYAPYFTGTSRLVI
ncbi:MAG TPA: translocation/assembly module TamB, partial [Methylomirabilota bacterium]|nr:translocation/assembly module TamB [Methylomirabilota bacterium]